MSSCKRSLKITVVGDYPVRISLIESCRRQKLTDLIVIDGKDYNLDLLNLDVLEAEKVQKSILSKTDCFLLCYFINSRVSFENVKATWHREIRLSSKKTPIILVGIQNGDDDPKMPKLQNLVKTSEANLLCEMLYIHSQVECSIHQTVDLKMLLEKAIHACEDKRKTYD